MALPRYPASLPCPLRADYGWTPGGQHERTSFGGPFEHVERIYSGSNLYAPHAVVVSADQLLTLRAWVRLHDPAIKWVLMQADIGEGVQYYEARMLRLDIPRSLIGVHSYTVPFDLEIRAKEDGSYWDLSDDDADIVLDGFLYENDDIF